MLRIRGFAALGDCRMLTRASGLISWVLPGNKLAADSASVSGAEVELRPAWPLAKA